MWILWKHNAWEEYWGFLLFDAHNYLNEENHIDMLWSVRYEYPIFV